MGAQFERTCDDAREESLTHLREKVLAAGTDGETPRVVLGTVVELADKVNAEVIQRAETLCSTAG